MQQLSTAAERVWITILRVGPHLLDKVEAALKAAGFPPLTWYDVLWELERTEGPVRPRDLGKRLLVARYNLSRLLDRLEAEGLIARAACADDARGQVVKLTRAGKALRTKMWPSYESAVKSTFENRLTGEEADTLANLLNKLR